MEVPESELTISVNGLTTVATKHEKVLDLVSPELVVAKQISGDRTPLHFAAENGHDKIVEKLLAHNPGLINAQDSDLKTALYLAIEHGHDLVVAELMRFNPNFELEAMVFRDDEDRDEKKRTRETKSAVCLAVEKGHEKIVSLLLANDAALGKDDLNRTPLHLAAAKGLDSMVTLLLAREPSVADVRDCYEETALHYAVWAGHANIVAQLLAHNPATVHAVNKTQESVFHLAAESGSVEIAELLLAANAAIDAVDEYKSSVLHRAVYTGRTELVEFLLARKALVTDNPDASHPLIYRPVTCSQNRIVAMLLAHSPQLLDARWKRDGSNALHYATDPEIVQQLLSVKPALLEELDRNRYSPLYVAVESSRDKVVAQMLAQCPGVDVFGEDRTNIPFVAFTRSDEKTLEVLLAHKPELIHVKLGETMLLHHALSRRSDFLLRQAFITKVWELNKQAVHVAHQLAGTPFHFALQTGLDWAIEMMQGQLPLDEIVEACKRTQTSQDRFRPYVIIEQLLADVTEVVCEYLGFDSCKRVGKRVSDD